MAHLPGDVEDGIASLHDIGDLRVGDRCDQNRFDLDTVELVGAATERRHERVDDADAARRPASTSARTKLEPMKPRPPVTTHVVLAHPANGRRCGSMVRHSIERPCTRDRHCLRRDGR